MRISRIAIALFALLALALPGQAQQPFGKSTLSTQINQDFPDCPNAGCITPAILRGWLNNAVISWQQFAGVNAQVGTSYTIQASDYGQLVTFNNSGSVAVTLPQTINGGSSVSTFYPFSFYVKNLGAGTVTITPQGGSTINGASSYSIPQNQGIFVISDGTNYQIWAGGGSSVVPGNLPAGVPTNTLRTVSASGNVLTTDCGNTLQLQAPITLTLPSVSGFPVTCVVNFKNTSTTRGVVLSGFPTDMPPEFFPLQAGQVSILNGAWVATVNPGRWNDSTSRTFFIDPTNGSNSNDCLAAGASNACQTGPYVWALTSKWYINNIGVTLQYADAATGASSPYTTIVVQQIQSNGSAVVNIVGDTATPANVDLHQPSATNCIICFTNVAGTYVVKGFTLDSAAGSGNGNGLYVQGSGNIVYFEALSFGPLAGGFQITAINGGQISNANAAFLANGSYTISGVAATHLIAQDQGIIHVTNGTVTCGGAYAFTTFVRTHGAGSIVGITPAIFSCASVTGTRWSAALLSLIDSGAPTSIPGNANGSPTANTLGTDGAYVD